MQQRDGNGYTRYQAPPETRAPPRARHRSGQGRDVMRRGGGDGAGGGTKQYANRGLVFVRDSGSGGVAYLKLGGHGEKVELALFPRKKRD